MPKTSTDIELQFAELPSEVQSKLLERLAQLAQSSARRESSRWESELFAMAADPQIQRELKAIDSDLGVAEADGLEKH